MTTQQCTVAGCGRPTQDQICGGCLTELVTALRRLASGRVVRQRAYHDRNGVRLTYVKQEHQPGLWEELQTTLTKQHKIGAPTGVWSRVDEVPLPFHAPASELSEVLTNTISTWARDFAETYPHLRPRYRTVDEAAAWLGSFPALLAGHPAAQEMHDEIGYVVGEVHRVVDLMADRVYVGPCDGHGAEEVPGFPACGSDVFGRPEMSWARCSVCGREYDVLVRRAWMLASLEDHLGSSTYVATVCTGLGVKVSASTIRMWVKRRKLQPRYWAPSAKPEGSPRPMYRVGDVVAVAAGHEIASYTA